MSIYVDPLMAYGLKIPKGMGTGLQTCHLFTDEIDLTHLHQVAQRIGMRRQWFQDSKTAPHYDLTVARRVNAIHAGAISVDFKRAVEIWHKRQALVAQEQDITARASGANQL